MEHGGQVEDEDMARFIQQLEGRSGTEVTKLNPNHLTPALSHVCMMHREKLTLTYQFVGWSVPEPLEPRQTSQIRSVISPGDPEC